MKSKRHNRILEIINEKEIETQEELAEELKVSGFEVTQATISRDIKILKLLKVQSMSGKYRYVAPTKEERNLNDKLYSILANSAISVEKVDKFVVVKTLTGAASAAAEAIDSLYSEDIAGTIAGDNTIFILIRTEEKALELIQKYTDVCIKNIYNFKLRGDEFFDKIENWLKELDLGVNTPRSHELIKQSVISGVKDNPIFSDLKDDYRFKSCVLALETN